MRDQLPVSQVFMSPCAVDDLALILGAVCDSDHNFRATCLGIGVLGAPPLLWREFASALAGELACAALTG